MITRASIIDGKQQCLKHLTTGQLFTAESTCIAEEATVPVPRSNAENDDYFDAFVDLLPSSSGAERIALGITDVQTEGQWVDANNEQILYTNWESGQPDNWNGEHYAEFKIYNKQWNDLPDTWPVEIVCQL